MRNVAIIAGLAFPPSANANVHRVLAWCRHLPTFGWHVSVVSLPVAYRPPSERDESLLAAVPPTVDVRRVPPLLLKRLPRRKEPFGFGASKQAWTHLADASRFWSLLSRAKRHVVFPDTRILWAPRAVHEVSRIRLEHPVHAVLSTSRENSSHIAGWLAARLFRIPWVADFQDPWESPWSKAPNRFQEMANREVGRRLLNSADAVTAMSWNTRNLLIRTSPQAETKIHVVTNGFEPDDPNRGADANKATRFRIVHTGKLYGHRRLAPLLEATDRACREDSTLASVLELRLVGDIDRASREELAQYSARHWLTLKGPVPHHEARREQAEASVLLLVPGNESYSLPSKVFEYVGTGKPILALCTPDTDTARFLREVGRGLVVAPDDVAALQEAIRFQFAKRGEIDTIPGEGSEGLEGFTWRATVRRSASVLDEVCLAREPGS